VNDLTTWLVIGALVPILFVLVNYQAALRVKEFKTVALRLGLRYSPESRSPKLMRMPHALFKLGKDGDFNHILDGAVDGVEARVFEYNYSTGTGRQRSTYVQTVASFTTKESLPDFEMCPEHFYHRFEDLVGSGDIDFSWNPAFSAEYRLLGRDEKAVRALFNSSLSTALADMPGWSIEGSGTSLIVYRSHKRIEPSGLEKFLKQTLEVARAFGPA
jgi:hypothetical protein